MEGLSKVDGPCYDNHMPTALYPILSLDAVVLRVRAAGHEAFVTHTGGNTATIYAGPLVDHDDEQDRGRYVVSAGPGWLDHLGNGNVTAAALTAEAGEAFTDHDRCNHWCGVDECFAACGNLGCRVIAENGLGCEGYPGDDRPLTADSPLTVK